MVQANQGGLKSGGTDQHLPNANDFNLLGKTYILWRKAQKLFIH